MPLYLFQLGTQSEQIAVRTPEDAKRRRDLATYEAFCYGAITMQKAVEARILDQMFKE